MAEPNITAGLQSLRSNGYSWTTTRTAMAIPGRRDVDPGEWSEGRATIENGEFEIDGLYLGDYYLAEEIRDAIVIHSTSNDDRETSRVRWLSFAPGYAATTDEHGNRPIITIPSHMKDR